MYHHLFASSHDVKPQTNKILKLWQNIVKEAC